MEHVAHAAIFRRHAGPGDPGGGSGRRDYPERVTTPAPRRTRRGDIVVGPTVGARWRPGAAMGLPLLAVLLSPFAAAGVQQWRRGRVEAGHHGLLERLTDPMAVQLLLGALALWALFALWALVPMLATHRTVLLDRDAGEVRLRRGLRTARTAPLDQVVFAVGEAERGATALIGVQPEGEELQHWQIPEIAWDDASFDGLRALQAAAGLRHAPPRPVLAAESRRRRRAAQHRELAERAGMPWRPEYEHDEQAFQDEFDRVRRVLGGKEPPRPGDPTP